MASLYLIEFSYRSIYFLKFLDDSLKVWAKIVGREEIPNLTQKQNAFRVINNNNLLEYQKYENLDESQPKELNECKINLIRDWAKVNSINVSKDLPFEEIYSLNDRVYQKYIGTLTSLKKEKNQILQLLFPQLIKNLFGSFELLNKTKSTFLEERNEEKYKFTKLFLESEKKENDLKQNSDKIIKILKETISNQKNDYERKINILQKTIDEFVSENNSIKKKIEIYESQYKSYEDLKQKNMYLDDSNKGLYVSNENMKSEIKQLIEGWQALKNEIDSQKEKIRNLESKLENEKVEREKYKNQMESILENEKTEREKYKNQMETKLEKMESKMEKMETNLESERAEKEKYQNQVANYLESNNNKLLKDIQELFEKQKQEFVEKFQTKKP